MKTFVVMILTIAILGVGMTAPASAGEGCVSRGEISKVENGMTKRQVEQLFDTKGNPQATRRLSIWGKTFLSKQYPVCGADDSRVQVSYLRKGWAVPFRVTSIKVL